MPEHIHGHDVLDFMIASGASYTRATLAEAIRTRFGADAQFHTCSADRMSAEQLIEFLAQRGKFTGTEAGFTVDTDRVCAH
jgi:probable metal-binding protein